MRFRWLTIGVLVVLLALATAACGGKAPDKAVDAKSAADLQKEADEKIAALKAKKDAAPAEKTTEIKMSNTAQEVLDEVGVTYQYDPINKPDPFRPFNPSNDLSVNVSNNPLLKFEIRYFKLVGIVNNVENPSAIFEDPTGQSYTVRAGDPIGKNGGVVRAILVDAVVVTETRISWRSEGTETVEMTIRLRPEDKKAS